MQACFTTLSLSEFPHDGNCRNGTPHASQLLLLTLDHLIEGLIRGCFLLFLELSNGSFQFGNLLSLSRSR